MITTAWGGGGVFDITSLPYGQYANDSVGSRINTTGTGVRLFRTHFNGDPCPAGKVYMSASRSDLVTGPSNRVQLDLVGATINAVLLGAISTAEGIEWVYELDLDQSSNGMNYLVAEHNTFPMQDFYVRFWDGNPIP